MTVGGGKYYGQAPATRGHAGLNPDGRCRSATRVGPQHACSAPRVPPGPSDVVLFTPYFSAEKATLGFAIETLLSPTLLHAPTAIDASVVVSGARLRLLRAVLIAAPLALVAVFCVTWFSLGGHPGDAATLMAAGERLNAGHPLYALSPGDRPVLLNPPYWTVPLLSPPLLAVVSRPLAVLPDGLGAYGWWVAMAASTIVALCLLLGRAPLRTSATIAVLSLPVAVQLMVGNVDSLLLLGTIGVWWLSQRGRPGVAGVVAGLMFATKLTPFPIVWWLVVSRQWRSVRAACAAIAIGFGVSIAGAGLDNHLAYLDVIRTTNYVGTTVGSLAGIGRWLGIAPEIARWLPLAASLLALAAMALYRRRPRVTYAIAVCACVFGSPSIAFHTPAMLLAALAPIAWPTGAVSGRARSRAAVDSAAAGSGTMADLGARRGWRVARRPARP